MGVHLVGDTIAKLSTLRGMLEKRYTLKTELLSHADLLGQDIEAVVIAADLRDVDSAMGNGELGQQQTNLVDVAGIKIAVKGQHGLAFRRGQRLSRSSPEPIATNSTVQ